MGVKGLFPFLQKLAPSSIRHVRIEELRGQCITLDGNLLLFREYASPWLSADLPNKHILWAIRLARLCRRYDIVPIVVFDSKETTPAKAQERVQRTIKRDKVKNTLDDVRARSVRLKHLSSTIRQIDELSSEARRAVSAQLGNVGSTIRSFERTQVPVTLEQPLHESEAGTSIAKSLVKHINEVLVLDHASLSVTNELDLLMKLVDPDNAVLPVQEAQDLQIATAEIMEKLSRRVAFPTYSDIDTTFEALERFGIPCTISPDLYEGECTASYLVHRGLAQSVATQDSDVLIYGVPQMRNFMSVVKHGGGHSLTESVQVDPAEIKRTLAESEEPWSQDRFLDFALLCGTDFTRGITGLGIKTALHFLQEHASIETAISQIKAVRVKGGYRSGQNKYSIHEDFQSDLEVARRLFRSYPVDEMQMTARNEGRIRNLSTLNKQIGTLRTRYRHYDWDSAEHDVLSLASMHQSSLDILDDPRLYTTISKTSGKVLERPSSGGSETGIGGFIFR